MDHREDFISLVNRISKQHNHPSMGQMTRLRHGQGEVISWLTVVRTKFCQLW